MRKFLLISLVALMVTSCGTWSYVTTDTGTGIVDPGNYVVIVTSDGERLSIHYNDIDRYYNAHRYDPFWNNYRFYYGGYWHNGWGWYPHYRPYFQQRRARVVAPRQRVRVTTPRGSNNRIRNEVNRSTTTRSPKNTQSRNNGRRSGQREVVPT